MSLVVDNLWCKVFWSTTDSESSILNSFRESKVSEFKVSVCANEDVFRLEISVDNVFRVQVFKYEDDMSCIKAEYRKRYAAL